MKQNQIRLSNWTTLFVDKACCYNFGFVYPKFFHGELLFCWKVLAFPPPDPPCPSTSELSSLEPPKNSPFGAGRSSVTLANWLWSGLQVRAQMLLSRLYKQLGQRLMKLATSFKLLSSVSICALSQHNSGLAGKQKMVYKLGMKYYCTTWSYYSIKNLNICVALR